MFLDELFNSSFFITITLAAVLVSLLYMFVSNKLQEMNKKIQTMVDIIRSVTQEIEALKLSQLHNTGLTNPLNSFMSTQPTMSQYPNLIPIDEDLGEEDSDESSHSIEELDDEDDVEEEEEDDGEEEEEEEGEEEEEEEEEEEADQENKTKIIKKDNDMIVEELTNIEPSVLGEEIKVLNISTEVESEVLKELKKKKLPELKEILKEKKPELDLKNLKKDEIIDLIIK